MRDVCIYYRQACWCRVLYLAKLISPQWPFCIGAVAPQLMNVSCKGWLVLGPAKLGLLPDSNRLTLMQSRGAKQGAWQTKDARHNPWHASTPPTPQLTEGRPPCQIREACNYAHKFLHLALSLTPTCVVFMVFFSSQAVVLLKRVI